MTSSTRPEPGDIIVRETRPDEGIAYVLHTGSTVDQFIVRSREEAIRQALSFARLHRVHAWFTDDEREFTHLKERPETQPRGKATMPVRREM